MLTDEDFRQRSGPFREWLASQYKNRVTICSVCTGTFLLAEAGLLDGRSYTTHWKYTALFAGRYSKAKLLSNRLFVDENRLLTSAGVSSGIDLALHLVESLWSAHFAAKVAKEILIYFRRSKDDLQHNIFTQYRNHLEYRIHTVQYRLAETLGQSLGIEVLAEEVSMSRRKPSTSLFVAYFLSLNIFYY